MRESTRQQIQAELNQLEAQIKAIEAEGDYFLQAWVSSSKPSERKQTYPRVQSRLPQFGGKKVRHIRQDESVADWVAMCDRGQKIGRLVKRREQLAARLD
ncbi:MAG: hypothetical protein HC860_16205 [Alkalinema sp. RU_4_3]|nr:hypothetical protein [Alkalinema sp. RU_4_3]